MNNRGKISAGELLAFALILVASVGVVLIATGGGTTTQSILPSGGSGIQTNTTNTGLTGNPALKFTCVDQRNGQQYNNCAVSLYNTDGTYVDTVTTTSGVGSLSNLQPGKTYNAEVTQPGSATAFYPLGAPVTAPNAGSSDAKIAYFSMQNTAPTTTVYNSDDVTANTTAQAVGANDNKQFRIRIVMPSSINDNNSFGDGVGYIRMVIDYNSLAYGKGFQLTNKTTGTKLTNTLPDGSTVGVPTGHVVVDVNRTTTTAFVLDETRWLPASVHEFYLTVFSGAQDPVTQPAGGDSNAGIRVTFYDAQRYQNINLPTGGSQFVEGYRNAVTGVDLGAPNITVHANAS